MQPLYVTAYGNGKGLFGQPLIATVSYTLRQQCLTVYGNNVLQFMLIMSYNLYVVK